MTGITVIGLGPGGPRSWTYEAYQRLHRANELYLRTGQHPGLSQLPGAFYNFDLLFEQATSIEQFNRQIAAELVRLGQRTEGVIYATPGHPAIDDPIWLHLQTLAQAEQLSITLIPGLSLVEAARTALAIEPGQPLQIAAAAEVAKLHHPPFSPDQAALVTHLYPNLAAQVQRTLLNAYGEDFKVRLIDTPGSEVEAQWSCSLSDLARQPKLGQWSMLYLPADPFNVSFATFQDIIAHLRGPDGCPWDREQTHHSLRPFLLEETYEVLEALDAEDIAALSEELGDLLLQIVLQTQIAITNQEFKMGQVIGHISHKMLRRHPHVFGQVSVSGADEVVTNWAAIKKAEKAAKGQADGPHSILDGLPPALPALAQSLAICQRVVRVGFEWPTIEGVLDKLIEEAQEIASATHPAELEAEIGDFLFNAVNLARWSDVDPESALRAANARFVRRFRRVETMAALQGRTLPEMKLEEMQALWQEAKRAI